MINIALAYDDGRLGIMQYFAEDSDEAIQATINKIGDKPGAWKRVSEEEAAAIRAARTKPDITVPASATPMPAVNIAEITLVKQENEGLRQRLSENEHRLAVVESQFAMFAQGLSEAIAKHKAQDPAE